MLYPEELRKNIFDQTIDWSIWQETKNYKIKVSKLKN
jgi:hypothetical protein